MAKFGINDLMDIKSRESKADTANEYQEIWLSPYDVQPSAGNFYSQEKIEELADSFLAVGQQQPTVLARVDGKFQIVSGHRRNLANIKNLERGHEEYKKVRYLYKDMTPAMLELSLLMGNVLNRELTAWEKTQQAQRLKAALIRARDEDGMEIPGKLRDVVADIMNESSSGIARMDSIQKHAAPEIKEEFKKGNLGICAAYEAAKLPEEEQKEIAKKASKEGGIRAKEVAEKSLRMKKKGKRQEKAEVKEKPFVIVSNVDTGSQLQSDVGKQQENEPVESMESIESVDSIDKGQKRQAEKTGRIKPFRKADRHTEILRAWETESISLAVITEAVADAVQRVSTLDTEKADWTDTEWVVYLTRLIMNQADCVSEEDLYLLHDIMRRCYEDQEDI